jgi:hypothetical protein
VAVHLARLGGLAADADGRLTPVGPLGGARLRVGVHDLDILSVFVEDDLRGAVREAMMGPA